MLKLPSVYMTHTDSMASSESHHGVGSSYLSERTVSDRTAEKTVIAAEMAERRNRRDGSNKTEVKDSKEAAEPSIHLEQLENLIRAEMQQVKQDLKSFESKLNRIGQEVSTCASGVESLRAGPQLTRASHASSSPAPACDALPDFGPDEVVGPPCSSSVELLSPREMPSEGLDSNWAVSQNLAAPSSGHDVLSAKEKPRNHVSIQGDGEWISEHSCDASKIRSDLFTPIRKNTKKLTRDKMMHTAKELANAGVLQPVDDDKAAVPRTEFEREVSDASIQTRQSSKTRKKMRKGNSFSSGGSVVSAGSENSASFPKKKPTRPSDSAFSQIYGKLFRRVRNRTDCEKKVWCFLEDPERFAGGKPFVRFMALATVASAFLPLLQTLEDPPLSRTATDVIDLSLDGMFLVEVVLRLVVCPNRLAFFLSMYNFIDLIAGTLPLALRVTARAGPMDLQGDDLWETGLICAVPILRMLKLLRRFETFHLVAKAFRLSLEVLPVLMYILTVIILLFSSLIFIFEPRNNIASMPEAIWLSVVTVGTVGYGDIVPSTSEGTVVVSALIVTSALYMAIPIGIVGKAFGAVWDERDQHLLVYHTKSRFLSSGYKAADIPAMFCSLDADGDGEISLPEFMLMMRQMEINMNSARVVELFRAFDCDGSGTIDDQEFVRMLFPGEYAEIYGVNDDDYFDELPKERSSANTLLDSAPRPLPTLQEAGAGTG